MEHIRFTPDLVVRMAEAADGTMRHTEKLDAFAKVLGAPDQTVLMHALKHAPVACPNLDEMLEELHTHHIRTAPAERSGRSRERFAGLATPLSLYLSGACFGVAGVRLHDALRFPYAWISDTCDILGDPTFVLLERMADEAATGVYPDLCGRQRNAKCVEDAVKNAWTALPTSARRTRHLSKPAICRAARAILPGMSTAQKTRAVCVSLGYENLGDFAESEAFLSIAAPGQPPTLLAFNAELFAFSEQALVALSTHPGGDLVAKRLVSVALGTAKSLKVVAVHMATHPYHQITTSRNFFKADTAELCKMLDALGISANKIPRPQDLPEHRLSLWAHWMRDTILIGHANADGAPLREHELHLLDTTAGVPQFDSPLWDFVKRCHTNMPTTHSRFEEAMAILSLERDPVVRITERGWATRRVSPATLALRARFLLRSARNRLNGPAYRHFRAEGVFLDKTLQSVGDHIFAAVEDPAALRRILRNLEAFHAVALDEPERFVTDAAFCAAESAARAEMEIFRAVHILKAVL